MLVFYESGDPGFKLKKGSTPIFAAALVVVRDHEGERDGRRSAPVFCLGALRSISVMGRGAALPDALASRPPSIPVLEVWAAVVVMPLYAYDEKDFTHRLTRLI
jgi:hypothetical protein